MIIKIIVWYDDSVPLFKVVKKVIEKISKLKQKIIFLIGNCAADLIKENLSNVNVYILLKTFFYTLQQLDAVIIQYIKVYFLRGLAKNDADKDRNFG